MGAGGEEGREEGREKRKPSRYVNIAGRHGGKKCI